MTIIPSGFILILLIAASFCYGDQRTVEVIGVGECADCEQNNIKKSHALKGLRVTIDCKLENGEMKTRGVGELDKEGKFRVEFPQEVVEKEKLKEECYAQLHSASNTPCPSYNGIESSKLAFVSSKSTDGKHTFSPIGKLKFSPITCTSAFLWPFFKFPHLPKLLPPLDKFPKKEFPKISFPFKFFPPKKPCPPFFKKPFPPFPVIKKPLPPPFPIYKKPLPPPFPIYKKPLPPPFPIYKKPLPPPFPIYKKPLPPPVPIYEKPLPPPVPIYEKPLPPPVPIYEKPLPPPVPVYKKPLLPPVPVYKKPLPPPLPIFKKPCPPIFKKKPFPFYKPKPIPPFPYKKPWPPIPEVVLSHPKFPPKFFHHPKFKKFPSLPLVPIHP